jgi:hydroxyacylglutathione hydrolase
MMHEALNVKLARLPDDTRVFCGHEYTENNLRFAETLEPGNAALKQRIARVRAARASVASDWHDATEAEMTVPSTMADEKATNPFMRAHSAELVAQVRARMPEVQTDPVSILGAVRALKDKF